MILFDLKCRGGNHRFEGWFASGEDFARQKSAGLLTCRLCGDPDVDKAVMAPAVGIKGNRRPEGRSAGRSQAGLPVSGKTESMASGMTTEKALQLMQGLARAQAEALKESQWVGRQFADKARAMHYGEEGQAAIHGEVAPEEARSLIEEGVEVAPLLFPVVPPKACN